MNESDLLYYNGYGGFSLDGKEYIIKTCEKATPLPWSHVIANEMFGTIVTSNGGGYIWHGNSQSNKISSWSNDCLRDTPSEKIIIRFNNKSINLLPYDSSEKYTVIYGFGYAKYIYQDEDLKIETLIYVPTKISKKVYKIKINGLAADSEVVLEYWISPVLGVSREFTKNHIIIGNNNDSIIIKNKYREDYSDYDVYINSSGKLIEYKNVDSNLKMEISVNEYNFEKKCHEVQLEIGCFNYYEGNNLQDVKQDINLISCFWNDQMNSLKVYTPVESMNIMMNGWLLYQTLTCRMWARTSFYQAGGAFGFRDQLQDSLCLLWCNPEFTKNQILYHASHQFEEGDVLHWWHKEKNNGTRTRYTDDLLWLPFIVSKYIEFTGDKEILDIKVPYVKGEVLHDNEVERYMAVDTTSYDDTLYNHTVRAIKYGVKLSDNNLPKMNGGDWNDGMNQIKGQSIWLGFFIYTVLENFKSICDLKNDSELKKYCEDTLNSLKKGLNEHGWDGKWYRRAYFENGVPVGSSKNDECKIDGISQSWAVISGAGEKEKIIQAMESLDSYLVDKENMIIKLLTPPFDKTNLNPGYIKEYIPGVRENGGQYTHGVSCCGQFLKY